MINVNHIGSNLKFRVLGIYGEFVVIPAKWKICHFSTYASSNNESRAGNTESLLKELKPMRERVSPKEIHDMSALLQRDLNDARVANELIPYLSKNAAQIGFFPAVLCALMPTGFLEAGEEEAAYPESTGNNDAERDYNGHWKLNLYMDNKNNPTALGELEIDPKTTDIVVLDGQHRANAFRYLTGTFSDATRSDSIYSTFYRELENTSPFTSELPVTLVWFEKLEGEAVNPRLISRRLFVDVNTNAKSVSKSRNILLDDLTPSCVFTGLFYTGLARNGFLADQLSLLHGVFDSNDDNNKSAMSLFSPVAIDYAFRLFFTGRDECNGLTYTVERDRSYSHQNPARIARFIEQLTLEEKSLIDVDTILKSLHASHIKDGLSKTAISYAYILFSRFLPFKLQIKSTELLASQINSGPWSNTTRKTVWSKVYCGGEGLFYSLMECATNSSIESYKLGIHEVEEKFKSIRSAQCGDARGALTYSAYLVLTSIAGISGILMAVSKCAEILGWSYKDAGDTRLCVDFVVEELNKSTINDWLSILTEFKSGVTSTLEPKRWPQIRNIYLRVIENNSEGKIKFFTQEVGLSPDVLFVNNDFRKRVTEYEQNNNEEPDQDVKQQMRSQSIAKLNSCLAKCGLKQIIPQDYDWPEGQQDSQDIADPLLDSQHDQDYKYYLDDENQI
jgi:hypothetical protein